MHARLPLRGGQLTYAKAILNTCPNAASMPLNCCFPYALVLGSKPNHSFTTALYADKYARSQ